MKKIAELLSRDLSRRIEEVIQVDQAEEQAVFTEIDEYIATDSIRELYAQLLTAIAEAPSDPNEAIGVWVSGFFGSGKSSFAKNLGYALQNNKVQGKNFSDAFQGRIEDKRVSDLARPDQFPVSHRGHLFRHRQGARHTASDAADFRVSLRRAAATPGLRRGLRHRRA